MTQFLKEFSKHDFTFNISITSSIYLFHPSLTFNIISISTDSFYIFNHGNIFILLMRKVIIVSLLDIYLNKMSFLETNFFYLRDFLSKSTLLECYIIHILLLKIT